LEALPGTTLGHLQPQIGSVKFFSTTSTSLRLEALVNITNPTPYTAYIPYVDIHVMKNGSIIGSAAAEKLNVTKCKNTNLLVTANWDPSMGGAVGHKVGRDLLSQYISGYNVTIDVKAHRDSIPGSPVIGEALSKLNITIAAPKLDLPGDDSGDKGHFIRDATFHIFSSTATFTLVSPLEYNTLYIDWVNATAFYNHTEPVGQIEYNLPFAAPPGASLTPKLPVDWSIGSVGYAAVRTALGGALKLDAMANVTVRLGNWKETVWYTGKGIGASIRL
jgi:hypothetical protein